MSLRFRPGTGALLLLLSFFLLSSLSGCSQEAKKERHLRRAEKYFTAGQFQEAIIEYKNVVQIDPKDALARYKLGLSHLQVGQLREAYSEFSKSVELNPGLLEARFQLGSLYLLSRDLNKAKEQAESILAKDPHHAGGFLLMSSVHLLEKDLGG